MKKRLMTIWGERLDPAHMPEDYPRPQMVRKEWTCLNGFWDYGVTGPAGDERYRGKILVPFSPEAALSGVRRMLKPDETAHYRKEFTLEEDLPEGRRVLLHFGAVDQRCAVYVNGHLVGKHEDGYLPFSFDITDQIRPGRNSICLKVRDASDQSYHARGKQTLTPHGMWYTAQSGIWQTVWMETVPAQYIERVEITPDIDREQVIVRVLIHRITDRAIWEPLVEQARSRAAVQLRRADSKKGRTIKLKSKCGVKVLAKRRRIAASVRTVSYDPAAEGKTTYEKEFILSIPDPHLWSPEDPFLYNLEITCGEDRVRSYFAMRKFSLVKDRKKIKRCGLNNKPILLLGLLDQGYWPEGLYTAPSDEALVYDIRTAKALGFNTLRKHCKVESDRWYYHCDRLGMIVWQDIVNGGGYGALRQTYIPNILMNPPRHWRDDTPAMHRYLCRADERGRAEFPKQMKETVKALYSHPSIAEWGPFNEGWGQFDADRITQLLRKTDPTRLIDQASGWFDQWGGDFYSIHNYFKKTNVKPDPTGRAVAVTECGGYNWYVSGHSCKETAYGYGKCKSCEELTERIEKLWIGEMLPNLKNGLSCVIYTQISDVEEEVNGLLTYDRKIVKANPVKMRAINQSLFEEFRRLMNEE